MFHIPKGKTLQFGLNTLSYDGAKLCNKFFHALLHRETDLAKNTFPWHMLARLVCCFCCFYLYRRQITFFKTKYWLNINLMIIKYIWWTVLLLLCVFLAIPYQPLIPKQAFSTYLLVFCSYIIIADNIIFLKGCITSWILHYDYYYYYYCYCYYCYYVTTYCKYSMRFL